MTGKVAVWADVSHGVIADLSKLRVLDTVVRETLRLHATASIGSVR